MMRMLRRFTPLGLLGLVLSACSAGDQREDEKPSARTDAGRRSWQGPPRASATGEIAVERFDEYVRTQKPASVRSPIGAAVEFLRLRTQARTIGVELNANPEVGRSAAVTVTLDGLLDDSVRAQRYVLAFTRRSEGTWRLSSARFSQRCQPGRGHQSFSPKLCL